MKPITKQMKLTCRSLSVCRKDRADSNFIWHAAYLRTLSKIILEYAIAKFAKDSIAAINLQSASAKIWLGLAFAIQN